MTNGFLQTLLSQEVLLYFISIRYYCSFDWSPTVRVVTMLEYFAAHKCRIGKVWVTLSVFEWAVKDGLVVSTVIFHVDIRRPMLVVWSNTRRREIRIRCAP